MTLHFTETELHKIVVHTIGCKKDHETLALSKSEFTIQDETLQTVLKSYFLKPFKSQEIYSFAEQDSPVKTFVSNIFESPAEFYVQSANIAKHLFDVSTHPNIKRGELYVVHFTNCVFDDEMVDAIGIFKSENKETYLKIFQQNDSFGIESEDGININKLDKGCLIFNTEKEDGYKICVVDSNKAGETVYWIEDFLNVKERENNFYKTKTMLAICKEFGNTVLVDDNDVDSKEKMAFMNNSIEYFKENEQFDIDEYSKSVIKNPQIIEAFNNFKAEYEETMDIEPVEQFDINNKAVKTNSKNFKSIIKLDKNFHIYVHSKPEMIEKSYDEDKNMKYYKLFYESES